MSRTQYYRRRDAFTLIELLVVVAIIVTLIAILLPALSGAREQAKSVTCCSMLRQIYTLNLIYADEQNGWLPLQTDYDTAGSILAATLNVELKTFKCPSDEKWTTDIISYGPNTFVYYKNYIRKLSFVRERPDIVLWVDGGEGSGGTAAMYFPPYSWYWGVAYRHHGLPNYVMGSGEVRREVPPKKLTWSP